MSIASFASANKHHENGSIYTQNPAILNDTIEQYENCDNIIIYLFGAHTYGACFYIQSESIYLDFSEYICIDFLCVNISTTDCNSQK